MTSINDHVNGAVADIDFLSLDPETRNALGRLQKLGYDKTNLSSHSLRRLAAVLLLLYYHEGALRILLTTRSKNLRSHPGQTALPGGRVDEEDKDAIETAFREANEEVTLPFPLHLRSKSLAVSGDTPTTPHIHTLCTLSPHLSQWGLVVTPVIAFLSSPSPTESAHAYLQSTLRANPDEVDCIFTHPLEAFLDPTLLADPTFLSGDSETRDSIKLAPKESEDWPYEEEYYTSTDRVQPELGNTVYRMHRFRSTASPIKGLTAEILMRVATIAYNKPPALPIEQYAPGQVVGFDQITRVLRMNEGAKTRDSD